MQRLVTAEYYKLWKNKGIYTIFALSCMPILFGLLVSLKLNGLTISEGAFDLISFPNNMWQFFIGTSLPIIILSYLSASLGRELKNGTLTYQLTRTVSRKKIIISKVLTILSFNLFYFILFFVVSFVTYILFIQGTVYSGATQFDAVSRETILTSLLALVIQITFCLLSLLFSLKVSTIGLVSIVFVATSLLSMVSNIKSVSLYVPGSIFYAPHMIGDGQFLLVWVVQLTALILLSVLTIFIVNYKFVKK